MPLSKQSSNASEMSVLSVSTEMTENASQNEVYVAGEKNKNKTTKNSKDGKKETEKSKSISQKYRKMEHEEHVLERPGMYIGSIEFDTYTLYVFQKETYMITKKSDVKMIPGLYKIVDEIIVNAIDHSTRMQELLQNKDNKECEYDIHPVKTIKVNIDKQSGTISVFNDGNGIEIVEHPEYGIYIPELIFGHLLTSTNYDDSEKKTIGGQNGIGAKACNIYSKSFIIETVDTERKLLYVQDFKDNMKVKMKPCIKKCAKKPYTKITFTPDYERFKVNKQENGDMLSDDMYNIFAKRCFDLCALTSTDINVFFNDEKLNYKTFERYIDLYLGAKSDRFRAYEKLNDRWEICVAINDRLGLDQVSFVNGVCTTKGGKHVDYIVNQVANKLCEMINKKRKNVEVKPNHVKNYLMVFVKATIENPTFDSQTKDALTTPVSKFGSKAEVSEKFIDKLYKSEIVDKILNLCDKNTQALTKKSDGKKQNRVRGLAKLDDANFAGTTKSKDCTLILTEGDSAKTMALEGLSEVGRDLFGVYPLRGKLMNVKDVTDKKMIENKEIQDIKKILGLESGRKYKSTDELRYGKIMVMTDQDSVTGDTPILLKNKHNDEICVHTIQHVFDQTQKAENVLKNGKDYGHTHYQVWTENGWSPICQVMRHMVQKRIFRVLTHTGIVDVTEDHSLLKMNSEKIAPKDCKVDDLLLHSFPHFDNSMVSIYNNENIYEAWLMGLFWADGSYEMYEWKDTYKQTNMSQTNMKTSLSWVITNTNYKLLEKAKNIGITLYGDYFTIVSCKANDDSKQSYKLIFNGGEKTRDIIEMYSNMFYYKNSDSHHKNGDKYIHPIILNASFCVREAFMEGYMRDINDCTKNLTNVTNITIDVESKISAQCIFCLSKSVGYEVYLNHRSQKPTIYSLILTKGYQQDNPNRIRQIWDLGILDQYVYDFETENHHFQAGVGQMIVSNTDGSHIKGLIMNMFHTLWPSLMVQENFITCMITPIVKVSKGKVEHSFYNLTDYQNWFNDINQKGDKGVRDWKVKYYKGLGTSNDEEAKSYFRDMFTVHYDFDDQKNVDQAFDLAFNKKKANERKEWIGKYDPQAVIETKTKEEHVRYIDFVNKELIHFSVYDVKRSIPCLVDGLKPSQRKVLYGAFKRNLTTEAKVSQLAGYISEHAAYHHGEASLQMTIVGMAQDFVGSNNMQLLMPNGMFGSRNMGGKDAAQARYIYTQIEPLTFKTFIKEDNNLLKYLDDDGFMIEPEYYVPIIPMILVNGALGIGTGYSTSIPSFNPHEIIDVLKKCILNGGHLDEDANAIKPWYRGFTGKIKPIMNTKSTTIKLKNGTNDENNDDASEISANTSTNSSIDVDPNQIKGYSTHGCYTQLSSSSVEITELPIGTWTEDYKEFLENYLMNNPKVLKDFESHSTKKVRFILHFYPEELKKLLETPYQFETEFKLISKNISLTNMHLFDERGVIQKYHSVKHIIESFYKVRHAFYVKRKAYNVQSLKDQIEKANTKALFIQEVMDNKIEVMRKSQSDVHNILVSRHYPMMDGDYGYLLRMPIYTFTKEKYEELLHEVDNLQKKLMMYESKTEKELWIEELNDLADEYKAHYTFYMEKQNGSSSIRAKVPKRKNTKVSKK